MIILLPEKRYKIGNQSKGRSLVKVNGPTGSNWTAQITKVDGHYSSVMNETGRCKKAQKSWIIIMDSIWDESGRS